jgi:hypothetical protein
MAPAAAPVPRGRLLIRHGFVTKIGTSEVCLTL